MFILDSRDGGTAMFAKGQKVESNMDLWQKRIGHVNYQWLQELQSNQVVFGLPKFSGQKAQICEACQLGKQHRLPIPNEQNSIAEKKNRSIVEVAREMLAQVLLGRGGLDRGLHPESDQRERVGPRAIFRNEAEFATLESFR